MQLTNRSIWNSPPILPTKFHSPYSTGTALDADRRTTQASCLSTANELAIMEGLCFGTDQSAVCFRALTHQGGRRLRWWVAAVLRELQTRVFTGGGGEGLGACGSGSRTLAGRECRRVVEVTHAGGRTLSSHGLLQRDTPLCGWHPRRTSRGTLQRTPWLNTKAPRGSCCIMAK